MNDGVTVGVTVVVGVTVTVGVTVAVGASVVVGVVTVGVTVTVGVVVAVGASVAVGVTGTVSKLETIIVTGLLTFSETVNVELELYSIDEIFALEMRRGVVKLISMIVT